MDDAALALALGGGGGGDGAAYAAPMLDVAWRPYPQPPNRLQGIDIAGGEGGLFTYASLYNPKYDSWFKITCARI